MTEQNAFFKARNKQLAYDEIISRLGGSSEATEFLTNHILGLYRGEARMKKFPMAIFVHESKPQFCLNDGETLEGIVVDLESKKELSGNKYMGSADTAYWHKNEQLSEGMETPQNVVAIFITKIPAGPKLAWTVSIVGNLRTKISNKSEPAKSLEKKELTLSELSDKIHDLCQIRLEVGPDELMIEVDRGPRTDHGGGRDGEDWMSDDQVDNYAKEYKEKHQSKLNRIKDALEKLGVKASVQFEYGEKGHCEIYVFVQKHK